MPKPIFAPDLVGLDDDDLRQESKNLHNYVVSHLPYLNHTGTCVASAILRMMRIQRVLWQRWAESRDNTA